MMTKQRDHIDQISQQWKENHSELDNGLVEIIGRFSRLNKHLENKRATVYSALNINAGEFDVLATLYRNGSPYKLMPSDLVKQTLLTSGAMTNRLDRLEKKGLIQRVHSDEDRRCVVVGLTEPGLSLIQKGSVLYFDKVATLYEPLTDEDQTQLNGLLKKWVKHFED
jgi:DNA-binding MarR family transcriptional regulator